MDPRAHQRYLDYIELRRYFARPGSPEKLAASDFEVLDRELVALLRKERDGETSSEEARRIKELRRMLFRD